MNEIKLTISLDEKTIQALAAIFSNNSHHASNPEPIPTRTEKDIDAVEQRTEIVSCQDVRSTTIQRVHHICNKKELQLIQEKVDELLPTCNKFAKTIILSKAIKQLMIPAIVETLIGKIEFPEDHKAAVKGFTIPSSILHDALSLYAGGVPASVIAVLCEITSNKVMDKRAYRLLPSITKEDVEQAKEKYKTYLKLYGVYDAVAFNTTRVQYAAKRTEDFKKRTNDSASGTISLTPEQVDKLVKEYNEVGHSRMTKSVDTDLRYAANRSGIKGSLTLLRRAAFAHAHLKGYEHIPNAEPITVGRAKEISTKTYQLVQEIKYLRDYKKVSMIAVKKLTGVKLSFINSVYNGQSYLSIALTPDMKAVFDSKYKDLQVFDHQV